MEIALLTKAFWINLAGSALLFHPTALAADTPCDWAQPSPPLDLQQDYVQPIQNAFSQIEEKCKVPPQQRRKYTHSECRDLTTQEWLKDSDTLSCFLPDYNESEFSSFRSGPDCPVMIWSKSCESLEPKLMAMRSWTKSMGFPVGSIPKAIRGKGGKCIAEIDQIVPRFVVENQDVHEKSFRTQCFDAVMRSLGLSAASRNVDEEEIRFWMNSPLCKPISPGTRLKAGDIGVIYETMTNPGQPSYGHVFVHVGDGLIYQKDGPDFPATWGFRASNYGGFFDFRYLKRECERPAPSATKNCRMYSEYFRCKPFSSVQSSKWLFSGKDREEQRRLWNELSELEKEVAEISRSDKKLSTNESDALNKRVQALRSKIALKSEKNPKGSQDLTWKALDLKIGSIFRGAIGL